MTYKTLVTTNIVQQHINDADWVVMDARFALASVDAGFKAYRMGHLPNARYAHLDKDLSSAITGFTGRHPLPDYRVLVEKLGRWGICNTTQVVVYDDASGAFAGRFWWLLRSLGHDNVTVLDGGFKQWQKLKLPTTTALPAVKPCVFRPYPSKTVSVTATQVQDTLAQKTIRLIDARTPERFRGELEPIDPIAGHIPNAINRPFQHNLDSDGLFLSPTELQTQFKYLTGGVAPEQVVHMCGSGVTACHNLLAMEYAGLRGSQLYAGSWSEWIRNKNRAIAKG